MKSQRILISLTIGAIVCTGVSTLSAQEKPIVISPPAIKDGSNWSRAPFPAKRQFDDVKAPDGQAIDTTVPPNTPATNIEPAAPAPVVAVMAPAGSAVVATTPAATVTTTPVATVTTTPAATTVTTTEPVLTPTGRPTVYATEATPVHSTGKPQVITPPAVRDGSNWSRAPFPAKRQYDDVKSPDGQAIDTTVPPNTPATNIEPAR